MNGDPRIPSLIELLRDPSPRRRRKAANRLGKLRDAAGIVAPALAGALEDEDSRVRCSAANALGRLRRGDRDTVRALVKCLRDSEAGVQVEAVRALGRIGAGAGAAIPHLRSIAESAGGPGPRYEASIAVEDILRAGGSPEDSLDDVELGSSDASPPGPSRRPSPADAMVFPDQVRCRRLALAFFCTGVLLRWLSLLGYRELGPVGITSIQGGVLLVAHATGVTFVLVGLGYEAMRRGRHPAWGFLALLSCLGLLLFLGFVHRAPRAEVHPWACCTPRSGSAVTTFALASVIGLLLALGLLAPTGSPEQAMPPRSTDASPIEAFDHDGVSFEYPGSWSVRRRRIDADSLEIRAQSAQGSYVLLAVWGGRGVQSPDVYSRNFWTALQEHSPTARSRSRVHRGPCSARVAGMRRDGHEVTCVVGSASGTLPVRQRCFCVEGEERTCVVIEFLAGEARADVRDGSALVLRSLRIP